MAVAHSNSLSDTLSKQNSTKSVDEKVKKAFCLVACASHSEPFRCVYNCVTNSTYMGEDFEKRLIDNILPKKEKTMSSAVEEELSSSQIHNSHAFNKFLADAIAKSDYSQNEEKLHSDTLASAVAREIRKRSLARRIKIKTMIDLLD